MEKNIYPIQPGDLTPNDNPSFTGFRGLQNIQIKIINNLIRQCYIPSKNCAAILWKRLADELGTPIDIEGAVSFIKDIERVYNVAGWNVESDDFTVSGHISNYSIIFSKK